MYEKMECERIFQCKIRPMEVAGYEARPPPVTLCVMRLRSMEL